MTKILDAYSRAVGSGGLSATDRTTWGSADVVGAFGMAKREHPLAVALARMFVGGDREAKAVASVMTRMLVGKAYHTGEEIGESAADLIAGLVLEWHRNSACRDCGGHGFATVNGEQLGVGRAVIGDRPCPTCRGSRTRPFDTLFPPDRLNLARWLRAEVERETAKAGAEAMRRLAPDLSL